MPEHGNIGRKYWSIYYSGEIRAVCSKEFQAVPSSIVHLLRIATCP
jgi:hypothetical protein